MQAKRMISAVFLLAALTACSNSGTESAAPAPVETARPAVQPFSGPVAVELVRWFAGGGNFYDSLPAEFPPVVLPDAFQVLGSQVTDRGEQLILDSPLAAEEAREALAQVFRAQPGWIQMEPAPARRPELFVPAQPPAGDSGLAMLEFCHDEHGSVYIQADYLGEDLVSLSRSRITDPAPGPWCERQQAARLRPGGFGPPSRFADWQPSLRLPEGETLDRGGGSDPEELGSSLLFRPAAEMAPAELVRHFDRQMDDQGWEREADWDGDLSAGAVWRRSPAGGPSLSAHLNLLESAEAAFEIRFGMREAR